MANLLGIPDIDKSSLELLEALGFNDAVSLARANAEELHHELQRANSILKLSEQTPNPAHLENWIASAKEITGVITEPAPLPAPQATAERIAKAAGALASAPVAIPLPARALIDQQLGVADIPPAIPLDRLPENPEIFVGQRLPRSRAPKPTVASTYVQLAEPATPRALIDSSRLRSIDTLKADPKKPATIEAPPTNDRIALLRSPRSSTNKGRNPQSRWYIRGVLHSNPVRIYLGAVSTLILMVTIPLAVIATTLLLLSAEYPNTFGWTPKWLIFLPLALPLLGIAYLLCGITGSCRICGQKLFCHRSHLKNKKAHHVSGLGYVLPLCLQIITFRWFRCTHCGTPVRLKE